MATFISLATGTCRACAYEPVAFDAPTCPRCGAVRPNPGVGNRFAQRGVVIGFLAGVLIGSICGLVGYDWKLSGILAGAVLGCLPGAFLGLVGGLFAAAAARLSGTR